MKAMEVNLKSGQCSGPPEPPVRNLCITAASRRASPLLNSRPSCSVPLFVSRPTWCLQVHPPRIISSCCETKEILCKPASSGAQAFAGRWRVAEGELKMANPQLQLPPGAIELEDALAFGNVANEKGLISICGFGSLLSEKSARYTFPTLVNFRVAVLSGFRRVFAHVAPIFLERGVANVDAKELSGLSVEPFPGESVIITVFEISVVEVPAFIEREHEYRFLAVTLHSLQGEASSNKAGWIDNEEYHRRYGRFNIEQIWRDDILPCRVYLRHCVLAAKNLSQDAYDSFLDHTYLGDRLTTIRQHLTAHEQIMLEQPPPSLRERYGG